MDVSDLKMMRIRKNRFEYDQKVLCGEAQRRDEEVAKSRIIRPSKMI